MISSAHRMELEAFAPAPMEFISDTSGSVQLLKSRFLPFEGNVIPSNHIKIGMNVGTTSHLYHQCDHHSLEEDWRRNGITVNLPNTVAVSRSAAVTMLGLTLEPEKLYQLSGIDIHDESLMVLAGRISMDAYAARCLRDTFSYAKLHGCSTAFFDEKLAQLLERLFGNSVYTGNEGRYRLDDTNLLRVSDFIDGNLEKDISVADMAYVIEMDITNFTKAFKAAVGMPPYGYLTLKRIERSKQLLLQGMNVTEASLAVNYANPSKFAAAFRRCTGYSPSFWRNMNANKLILTA